MVECNVNNPKVSIRMTDAGSNPTNSTTNIFRFILVGKVVHDGTPHGWCYDYMGVRYRPK